MFNLLSALGAVVLGLALGSVVAALAVRIPRGKGLLEAPKCTQSGERLALIDVVPLIGYLRQGGVCRHCGKALPRWFPLTELAMALLTLLALAVSDSPVRFGLYTAYMAVLLLIIVIDARLHEIYFSTLIVGAVFALAAALLLPEIDLGSALVGATVGGGFFLLIYFLARAIYKTEALGFGDVLLAILLGLISGFPGIISALFWGPIIGGLISVVLLIARRKGLHDYFPYAPGLCLAQMGFVFTHLSKEPLWDMLRLPILVSVVQFIWYLIYGSFNLLLGR